MKRNFTWILFLSIFLIFSCKLDENDTNISSLEFEKTSLEINVGDSSTVYIKYLPQDVNPKIEYSLSSDGIINISGESKKGCVVTGLSIGTTILIAKCDGLTAYLEVKVGNSSGIYDPYIVLPYTTLEIERGKKVNVIASLFGGTGGDNVNFKWYTDSKNITIESASNSCVINAINPGVAKITVSHPKSEYPASMLVVVPSPVEHVNYLTTENNVIKVYKGDSPFNINVSIAGKSNSTDNLYTVFTPKENKSNISIVSSNGRCSVSGLECGISTIEVSNYLCKETLLITVIVSDLSETSYIVTDNDFLIIENSSTYVINASVVADSFEDYSAKFTYSIEDDSVIDVSQNGSIFYVYGKKDGITKIILKNEHAKMDHEILVVVQNFVYRDIENYITCEKNIIKTEIGSESFELKVLLTGGNESDKNNFIYKVSDSSVIEVLTNEGSVNYSRAAVIEQDFYETKCMVTPKGVGKATVEISHPKCDSPCYVTVIVYPKGVLNAYSNNIKGPEIIKVLINETKDINLNFDGDFTQVSGINWNIDNENICKVTGNDYSGVITGVSKGITTLTVSGNGLEKSYSSIVICGNEDELETLEYFYTDSRFISLDLNTKNYFEIKYSDGLSINDFEFSVNDQSIINAFLVQNVIGIETKKEGKAEIILKHKSINDFYYVIYVDVFDSTYSIEYPFSISGPDFIGVVKGQIVNIDVTLNNSFKNEDKYLSWINEDNETVSVNANGNHAVLKGLAEGQSMITVSHPSSRYSKYIYCYVVSSQEELNNKVILYSEKNNYLINTGDSIFLKVFSNNENIYPDLVWSVSDAEMVNIESENNMALLHFNSEGNIRVDVSYNDIKYRFYISVKGNYIENNYDFDVPKIIELVRGNSKKIKADTNGLNKALFNTIEWSCDSDIIGIEGNGDECYIQAFDSGCCYIYVKSNLLGIDSKIVVNVCNDLDELKTSYLITLPKTIYSIKKNTSIDLNFLFGTYKPSNDILCSLKYEKSNDYVDIENSGTFFTVTGKECGSTEITVSGEGIKNELKFTVNVYDEENSIYSFICSPVIKLKIDETKDVSFNIINNNNDSIERYYSDVEIRNVSSDCVSLSLIQNNLRIKGLKKGTSIIKIYSPSYDVEKSILVYCAENDEELDSCFIFGSQNDHYLLNKGNAEIIKLISSDMEEEKFNRISCEIEDPSLCSIERMDSSNFKIEALEEGNTRIVFRYNDFSYVIYISITNNSINSDINIFTENLIILNKGEKYTTHVVCQEEVSYSVSDCNVIEVERNNENYFDIEALEYGMSELKVYHQKEERVIRVYVVSDKEGSSLFNIDKRYYKITKGESVKIHPFYNFKDSSDEVSYINISDNNVITYNVSEGSLNVKGLNCGIASIKVCYKDQNDLILYFEVSEDYSNDGNVENVKYTIYSDKSILYLNPGSNGGQLQIYVDGIEGSESLNDGYIWTSSDEDMVSIRQFGYVAIVTPLVANGECTVSVSNPKCSNVYTFKIKIGDTIVSESIKTKYIYVPVNTVGLDYSGESKTVEVTLKNIDNPDISKIRISNSKEGIVNLNYVFKGTSLYITLSPLSCGYGRLILSHEDCEIDSFIDYVVNDDANSDIVYLTTSDNYVSMKSGEVKELNVILKNYDEINGSNFRYEYDSNYLFILGEGNRVSLHAVQEGITTVKVYHPKSKNYLTVTVNINNSNVTHKYITTSLNVIETSVSSVMDSFMVTLVGDSLSNDKFTYTSSDYSVLSVVGNNNYCFYRGISEGTAQITINNVSDPSILPLTVTVVVEEGNTDGQFMTSKDKVMYLSPNGANKTVDVDFVNVSDVNDSRIEWYIYSQENTDYSTGDVIRLNYSGKRGVITPVNKGIAKIRVTYAPLKLKFDFAVFVSEYGVISFADSSITVSKDEVYFENIFVPSVSNNLDGLVSYTVDNDSVLNVFGTSKVCCIKGLKEGTAIIKAYNSYDQSCAELSVKVIDESENEIPRINVNQSSFLLNPRSLPQSIKASVSGRDISVLDSDDIEWSVEGNSSVYIYPLKGSEVTLSLKNDSNGFVEQGDAVITAKLKKDNQNITKKIFVSVNELQNFFTLDNSNFTVDTGNTINVTATILGASNTDYDDVIWSIDKKQEADGTMVSVGQVLNDSGKTCTIMGVEEGSVTLYCWYKGSLQTARISVKGNRYFSVVTNSITMFPDQEYTISYNLRPSTYSATWYSSCEGKICEVMDDNHDTQEITVKAYTEGLSTITGVVNGIGTVIINIKVEYNPQLINRSKNSTFEIKMFDHGTARYDEYKNAAEIEFLCYPPEYYVDFTLEGDLKDHLDVQVEMNHDHIGTNDMAGVGKLIVTARKEIPSGKQVYMTVIQYSDKEKKNKISGNEFTVGISAYFYDESATRRDDGFSIYWKRYDGGYSIAGINYDSPDKDMLTLFKDGIKTEYDKIGTLRNDITIENLTFGEGETHYLIVEPKHKGQYFVISKGIGKNGDFTVQDFNFVAENDGRFVAELKTFKDENKKDMGFDCRYNKEGQVVNDYFTPDDKFYPRFAVKIPYVSVNGNKYNLTKDNMSCKELYAFAQRVGSGFLASTHEKYWFHEIVIKNDCSICNNLYGSYGTTGLHHNDWCGKKVPILVFDKIPYQESTFSRTARDKEKQKKDFNYLMFNMSGDDGFSFDDTWFKKLLYTDGYNDVYFTNNFERKIFDEDNHDGFRVNKVEGSIYINLSEEYSSFTETQFNDVFNYSSDYSYNYFQDKDWIQSGNAYCLPSDNEEAKTEAGTFNFTINEEYKITFNYDVQIRDCYRNYRYVTYDKDGKYTYVINDIANPATQYLIYGQ